ncbi:ankyrin repeat-containing domain protein, partial [Paraphysoderma sedebokerense]
MESLCKAISQNDLDAARLILLQFGCQQLIGGTYSSDRILGCCISQNRLEILKLFVSKGLSVDAQVVHGHSMLAYSIKYEPSLEIAEYLIKEGADVNKRECRESPLEIACKLGYVDLVEVLLKKGAMVSHNNDDRRYLLTNVAKIICERDVRNHLDIFQSLIEYGAEAGVADNHMAIKRVKDMIQEQNAINVALKEVEKANKQSKELKKQLLD